MSMGKDIDVIVLSYIISIIVPMRRWTLDLRDKYTIWIIKNKQTLIVPQGRNMIDETLTFDLSTARLLNPISNKNCQKRICIPFPSLEQMPASEEHQLSLDRELPRDEHPQSSTQSFQVVTQNQGAALQ